MVQTTSMETMLLVCKTFFNDVAELQKRGLVAFKGVMKFDPYLAQSGFCVSPFSHLTPQQLEEKYPEAEWLPRMHAYVAEMAHRPLTRVSFEELFFFTDNGISDHLSISVALNGKKISDFSLRDCKNDYWFAKKDDFLYQEAVGKTPGAKRPEYKGFWGEFLEGKNSYDRRQRFYEVKGTLILV